jgi:predicted small metal-binding protein
VKTMLTCPCGELIEGKDEDELVEKVRAHLREKHPDHEYSREQILFMAY